MKQNIYKIFKTVCITACMLLLTADTAISQTTVTIGTGTSSSYLYGPYYRSSSGSSFDYSRYGYLYNANEMNIPTGATIIKVEWNKKNGTISGNNVFNIFMKNTSATSLSSGTSWGNLVTGATTVYASNTQSFMTTGWVPFTLDAPFEYTGGNLMIMTDHEKLGTASGSNNFYYTDATGYAIGYASSTAPNNTTTLSTSSYGNKRPNIRITWLPPCPAKVITHPANTTTCATDDASFLVVADSTQAYQWQHFTGNNWINLTDNTTYSGTATDNLTVKNVTIAMDGDSYRAIVTNTVKNCSKESDAANITVVPSGNASVIITAGPDSNICKNETITFYIAYTNGGATPQYRWLKNGVEIPGEESPTLTTSTLNNGDVIEHRLISSAQCIKPSISNPIKIEVNPVVSTSVDVTVQASGENIYSFTAIPTNGGQNPEYYWYINGKIVEGEHNAIFAAENLAPYDKVTVDMKTSLECAEPVVSSSRNITTGIETAIKHANAFSISPNPNNGNFTIKGTLRQSNAQNEITVEVTNLIGQTVFVQSYVQAGKNIHLPITINNTSPGGLYVVNITSGSETTSLRFIIQK